jgi:hypothetical protein
LSWSYTGRSLGGHFAIEPVKGLSCPALLERSFRQTEYSTERRGDSTFARCHITSLVASAGQFPLAVAVGDDTSTTWGLTVSDNHQDGENQPVTQGRFEVAHLAAMDRPYETCRSGFREREYPQMIGLWESD